MREGSPQFKGDEMIDADFQSDWNSSERLNKFWALRNWEIKSIRGYESKKGLTVHVVFRLKHIDGCCMQPGDCVCEVEKTDGEICWCHKECR